MAKLPRVICDRCLKDAEVEEGFPDQTIRISCHDEVHLIYQRELISLTETVRVWSNIKSKFWSGAYILDRTGAVLDDALNAVKTLVLLNSVCMAQGGKQRRVPASELDPLIDALLLFRADDTTVFVPVPEAEPKPPKVCTCAAINERNCCCR